MKAIAVIEAETPKKAFQAAVYTAPNLTRFGLKRRGEAWFGHVHDVRIKVERLYGKTYELMVVHDKTGNTLERSYFEWPKGREALLSALRAFTGVNEAESPKKAFLKIDRLTPWLKAHRFVPHGSNGWMRKTSEWALPDRQKYAYYVWFDKEAQEWVLKKEGQRRQFGRWQGWHDFGHAVYPQGEEATLLAYLKDLDDRGDLP